MLLSIACAMAFCTSLCHNNVAHHSALKAAMHVLVGARMAHWAKALYHVVLQSCAAYHEIVLDDVTVLLCCVLLTK